MEKRPMYMWTRRVAAGFTALMLAVGCLSAVAAPRQASITTLAVEATAAQVTAPGTPAASAHGKPGFYTEVDERDGRLWVFREGSEDLAAYQEQGRPARHVARPGAGPLGLTLKSTELGTIVDYVVSQPGFYTEVDERDGRLWVFREGGEDLAAFQEQGRPARHVVRPGAGPLGLTLKSNEMSVLDAYQARF